MGSCWAVRERVRGPWCQVSRARLPPAHSSPGSSIRCTCVQKSFQIKINEYVSLGLRELEKLGGGAGVPGGLGGRGETGPHGSPFPPAGRPGPSAPSPVPGRPPVSLLSFSLLIFLDTFFFLNEYFKAYTSTHCPLNSGHFCKRLSSSSCVPILGSEDKPRWRPCHPHWRGGGWQDRQGTFQVWLPSQLHTTPSNSKTGSLKGWAWIPFSQDEVLCDF